MEDILTSVSLNLSNQGNAVKLNRTNLYQFNCAVICGLDCLEHASPDDNIIPVSFKIDKAGDLDIKGINIDMINNDSIYIYSDKKVTTSKD